MLGAFCAIYALFYPATISIFDETSIVVLAYAIAHGTIYTEVVGQLWDFSLHGHMIGKFSPFHAALLAPAIATAWKLAFLVSAAFFVGGAFIVRGMLRREGLGSGWSALYFLLAGALYYSQTILAAVPAAVMCLWGVSLCLRPTPRPFFAGLAFGISVLFHPWMAPFAFVFTTTWCLENQFRGFTGLIAGALPTIAALAAYNFLTTGSPIQNVYTIQGHQHLFGGDHFLHFSIFYLFSLAVFPLAGWAVFSRRWSGTWALPAVAAVAVTMASLYYYRDGLNVGSTRVGRTIAEITGLVPGQRFLIPLSLIACLPAARYLNFRVSTWNTIRINSVKIATLGIFVIGFGLLSIFHQAYLKAFARIQSTLHESIPQQARVVAIGDVVKEFVPLNVVYRNVSVIDETSTPPQDAYLAMLVPPGQLPSRNWIKNRVFRITPIRSWIWNRDLLVANPARETGAAD